MPNGFPSIGVGAAALAARAGLSSPGAMAAALSGARAAAILGRAIPFVGSALLAAWLLNEYLNGSREAAPAVPGGPDWSGFTVECGHIDARFAGAGSNCGFGAVWLKGLTDKINRFQTSPGFYQEVAIFGERIGQANATADTWVTPSNGYDVTTGRVRRSYGPVGTLPTGAVDPPMSAGTPAQSARPAVPAVPREFQDVSRRPWTTDAFPYPAEMGTGRVGGYYPPIPVPAEPGYQGSRPWVPAIPGWPGVWPEAIDRPVDIPLPIPGVANPPVVRVIPGIGTVVTVKENGEVETKPIVRAAYPARPGPKVDEMKVRVNVALRGFKMFYSSATEAADFVDALHDALPPCRQAKTEKSYAQKRAAHKYGWNKKYRKSEASPGAKMGAVLQFLRDVMADPGMASKDACAGHGRQITAQRWAGKGAKLPGAGEQFVNKALQNLVVENFKDFVYGKTGQQIGALSKDVGVPFGFQTMRSVSQFNL